MKLSARNALKGKIVEITRGTVIGKVKVDIGGQFVSSLISVDSIDEMALKVGDEVSAIIKSTEVMLAK